MHWLYSHGCCHYRARMLAKQHIQKWAEEGFLFIRVPAGQVRRVGFESIDHSKHLSTQTGFHAFFHRGDGKSFGVVFTNEINEFLLKFLMHMKILHHYKIAENVF